MDWIPVTERLPERPEYDWVLIQVLILGRDPYYGVPHIAELRNGVWHADCYDGPLEKTAGVKVTHWMPLPEPPKEAILPGPTDYMLKEYINMDVKNTEAAFKTFKKEGLGCPDPAINYICDRRACTECHPECSHTTDIRHAQNFELVGDGIFEKTVARYFQVTSTPPRLSKPGIGKLLIKILKGEQTND